MAEEQVKDASSQPDELDSNEGNHLLLGLSLLALSTILTAIFYFLRSEEGPRWIELGFVLSAAAAISILIWQACDPFADAAQWVGIRLKIPSSVRGATLDAVASSMPELFTGVFFVMVALSGPKDSAQRLLESAEGYGSTIATCAGSSIYNMILIPALCAIAISFVRRQRPYIDVADDVIRRDGSWVIMTQIGLLVFLFMPKLDWWMAAVAILAYCGYILHLYIDTRRFRHQLADGELIQDEAEDSAGVFFGKFDVGLNGWSAASILLLSTLLAAGACYLLVELTNSSAEKLGVPPFFVAVILTAAVSSIPDTFVSLGSARRGDDSGAISNVFGSNIFDICIGMSIPLIVCCYLNDWQPIQLIDEGEVQVRGVVGLRVFLFVLTAVAMFMLWRFKKVTRQMGWLFCFLYALFVTYAVLGALEIVPV